MKEFIEIEIPAVGDRVGMVVTRPKELLTGEMYSLIIGHPGIGERGDGSDTGLDKLRVTGTWDHLEKRIKNLGTFILIQVQPRNNYEHGETDEAYEWAKQEFGVYINWNRVYLTGLSLGGGGTQRYLSLNPNAYQKFAAAAIVCPGPNKYFVQEANYKNIAANAKHMALWFLHSADDTTVKPSESTDITIRKIKEIDPDVKVVRTLYKYEKHGAWVRAYGDVPAATPDLADDYNDPRGGVIEFFEINEVGRPPRFLPRMSDVAPLPIPGPPAPDPLPVEPTPVEIPPVEIPPVIEPAAITGISFSPPPNGFFYIEILRGNEKETYKVDRNVWMPVSGDKWGKFDLVFKDKSKNKVIKP